MYKIAMERGFDEKRLFSYEMTTKNWFHNDDETLKKEKNKSLLRGELIKVIRNGLSLFG